VKRGCLPKSYEVSFEDSKIRKLSLGRSSKGPNEIIITDTSNFLNQILKIHAPVNQQKVSAMPEKNKLYTGEEPLDYYQKKDEYVA
jgi:hypothetical protein